MRPGDGFPAYWVALLPVPATLILVAAAALVAADRPILARFLHQGLPPAAACAGLSLLALTLAPAPVSLEGVMAVHAVSGILACGVAWAFLRALPERRGLPVPDRMWHPGRWKALASRGWPYMASSIAPLLMARQDRVMLDFLVGPAETGLYAASAQLAQLVVLGLNAFNQIAVPKLAAAWNARDRDAVSRLSRRTTAMALGFAAAAMLVLALAGRTVLGWFGEEYLVALPALLWIGAANVFVALCGPCGYLMAITGHGTAQARIVGIALAVNTVLNLVLIPRHGATGAAAATAVALVSWNAGSFLFVTRRLALRTIPYPFPAP
jgi:O-antigen/teichoic acid export membrane protein